MIRIILFIFIVNNSITNKQEKLVFEKTIQSYARQVGVDLQVKRKKINDRFCTRYSEPSQMSAQYQCYKRYAKQKKGQLNLFVREPYQKLYGGGLGAICVRKSGGIALVAYRNFQPLSSAVSAAHEVFHNLGASHEEQDINEIMYPYYSSERINANGGMTVGQQTREQIGGCLR